MFGYRPISEKVAFTNVISCNTIIYMKSKNNLKTVRFTREEEASIGRYLTGHPYIKSFTTLVRAALWDYLQHAPDDIPKTRPSFLWDYDLSFGQIMEILKGPQRNRLWLVAKILEHAKWKEIWERKGSSVPRNQHDVFAANGFDTGGGQLQVQDYQRLIAGVRSTLGITSSSRVLDVGCGCGTVLRDIAPGSAVGVDYSSSWS